MPVDCQREALEVSPSIALDALKARVAAKLAEVYSTVNVPEEQSQTIKCISFKSW